MSLNLPPLVSIKDPAVAAALRAINDWARSIEPEVAVIIQQKKTVEKNYNNKTRMNSAMPVQDNKKPFTPAMQDIVNILNSKTTKDVIRKFIEHSGTEPPIRLNAPVVFETVNGPARVWIGAGGIGGTYNNVATFGITSVDGSFFFGKETTPSKQITFNAVTGDLTFGSDIKLNFPNAETLEDLYYLVSTGGYIKDMLEADLASGVASILAGIGSDYRLDINTSAGYIVIKHKDAVYNGTATPGSVKHAIGITSAGIAMGFNRATDGQWVNAVAITATGDASFTGQVSAKGGSIVENFTVGAGLIVDTGGVFRCQKTSYSDTTAGWWMSHNGGSPNFHIGNSTQWMKFDTTNGLRLSSAAKLDSGSTTLASLGETANWAQINNMPSALFNYTGASDATRNKLSYQSSTPSNPAEGDLWCDTSVTPVRWRIYSNGAWREAGSLITTSVSPSTYISAGAIHGDRITAGTIVAGHISVDTLSSIKTNIGEITAGSINTDNFLRAYGRFGTGYSTGSVTVYAAVVGERTATNEPTAGLIGSVGNSTYERYGVLGVANGSNGSAYGVVGYAPNGVAGVIGKGGSYGIYCVGSMALSGHIYASGYNVYATYLNGTLLNNGNTTLFDSGATTGSATASFPGNNKPGSSTSAVWLPVMINGSRYYIPVWP